MTIMQTKGSEQIPVLNFKEMLNTIYKKQGNLNNIKVSGVKQNENMVYELGDSAYLANLVFDYAFYLKIQDTPFSIRYTFQNMNRAKYIQQAFCFDKITGLSAMKYINLILKDVFLHYEMLWGLSDSYYVFSIAMQKFIEHIRMGNASIMCFDYLAISLGDGEVIFWELPIMHELDLSLIIQNSTEYAQFYASIGCQRTLEAYSHRELTTLEDNIRELINEAQNQSTI